MLNQKKDQNLQIHRFDIGDVEVVRVMHYTLFGAREEPENCKKLHVGGTNGTSCQRLQVLMTNLLC